MTESEKKAKVFSDATLPARTRLDLTFILCDVINGYMVDAESILRRNGCTVQYEQKRKFNAVVDAIKRLKFVTKDATALAYKEDTVDTYCDDSDAYAEILYVMQDRIKDAEQMGRLSNYIKKVYKSKLGLIK